MKNRLVPGGDFNYDVHDNVAGEIPLISLDKPQKEINIQLPPTKAKTTTPTLKDTAAVNRLNSINLASSQDNSPTRDSSNGRDKTFTNASPKTINITD